MIVTDCCKRVVVPSVRSTRAVWASAFDSCVFLALCAD
jgi:hypothetical protein